MRLTDIWYKNVISNIQYHAGSVGDTSGLSDVELIRRLQQKEGYTQCFGRGDPLYPVTNNPSACRETHCLWHSYCELFRSTDVLPLERVFPEKSGAQIEGIRTIFKDSIARTPATIGGDVVGVKLKTLRDLDSIMRKMLLATPTTVVAEEGEDAKMHVYLVDIDVQPHYAGHKTTDYEFVWTLLQSSDATVVAKLLGEASPFVASGSLQYRARSKQNSSRQMMSYSSMYFTSGVKGVPIPEKWEIETFDAPHIGVANGDIMLTDAAFAPIISMELPVLKGVTYATLFKVLNDHPEELLRFRDQLRSSVEGMRLAAVGSESFAQDCRKLESGIRDQIRELQSSYRKAAIKTAFDLTGTAVAAWTLALYCILQKEPGLLTILGPGGVAYKLSELYSEYLIGRLALKDNPAYLLWEIGRTQSKGWMDHL